MKRVGCSFAVLMIPVAAPAQEPLLLTTSPALAVHRAGVGNTLPSNTEVWLSLNSGLTSKAAKVGDKFDLTVSRDVMAGEYVVIPRGTQGHGQLSYRTGKGAFGKSAKIEFDLVDVQVGRRFIPLAGHYRIEGNGNTGAAIGAVVAVGVFGAFVTGHSATASQGSEWKAYTREPILLALPPTSTADADARQSQVTPHTSASKRTVASSPKPPLGDDTIVIPM